MVTPVVEKAQPGQDEKVVVQVEEPQVAQEDTPASQKLVSSEEEKPSGDAAPLLAVEPVESPSSPAPVEKTPLTVEEIEQGLSRLSPDEVARLGPVNDRAQSIATKWRTEDHEETARQQREMETAMRQRQQEAQAATRIIQEYNAMSDTQKLQVWQNPPSRQQLDEANETVQAAQVSEAARRVLRKEDYESFQTLVTSDNELKQLPKEQVDKILRDPNSTVGKALYGLANLVIAKEREVMAKDMKEEMDARFAELKAMIGQQATEPESPPGASGGASSSDEVFEVDYAAGKSHDHVRAAKLQGYAVSAIRK